MKRKIVLLTDYKNKFGLKWDAVPYRSGMDKERLKSYFEDYGYEVKFTRMANLDITNLELENTIFLYTSSEDLDYKYKNYIEDIVLGLEDRGALIIPGYKYLRANNNKVFMEILKKSRLNNDLTSHYYGSLEDVDFNEITYPIVFKKAEGAISQGVALARNGLELKKIIKSQCATKNFRENIKDYLRKYKRPGYTRESLHRNKFILQEFIPNLEFDLKILIFGDKYYIFQRPVRKNDFRASGSGVDNYIYGSKVEFPQEILNYASEIFTSLDLPNLSIDIAYNESDIFLLEFQALYFGTVGITKSDGYYSKNGNEWVFENADDNPEKVYVDSINYYLNK